MKNYAEKTNEEINIEVAGRNGYEYLGKTWIDYADGVYSAVVKDGYRTSLPDYCNNWADAGPVIAENKISITTQSKGKWFCYFDDEDSGFECSDKNPLRSAMIVFLMMKDNETRILAPDEVSDE